MNKSEENNRTLLESESVESIENESTMSLTSKSSSVPAFKLPKIRNKTVATKTMVTQALKALSANSNRKGFSLAAIQKYISQNYLATDVELQPRKRFIKKFITQALERGQLTQVKGNGLTGSFRVPSNSALHKNAKQRKSKTRKSQTKRQRKSSTKRKNRAGVKLSNDSRNNW